MNSGNRFSPLAAAFFLLASFVLQSCGNKNISVVTNGLVASDDGYALAIHDLVSVLKSSGYKIQVVTDPEMDTTINGSTIVIEEVNEGLGEAYRVKQKKIKGRNSLKVEGGKRGLMYGIFKLAEEIRLKKRIWSIDLEKVPEFPRRMYAEEGQLLNLPSVGYHLFQPPWVNHDRLEAEVNELKLLIDQVARMGFNTFTILHVNFEDYINYKYLDREVYGRDDVHRIKSVHFARHMADLIHYAHRRHIEVFLQVYEFQFPPRLGELYQLDLQHPDTEKIINAKVRELFESVPFDGLVITATESNPRSGCLVENNEVWQTVISGIALQIVDGGIMENITVRKLTMNGIGMPVNIRLGDRNRLIYGSMTVHPGIIRNIYTGEIIPDLIDAGLDILNPVQYTASGMELSGLKRDFGKDLVFWGGGIDTQTTLNNGTPGEVREVVKKVLDTMAPGGGFVFNPVHNIQDDVSPENFWAMWETLQEYGKY